LELLQGVLEKANKEKNTYYKKNTNDDCEDLTLREYIRECWENGSRCKKITKLFENDICYPPDGYPKVKSEDMVIGPVGDKDETLSDSCKKWVEKLKQIFFEIRHSKYNVKLGKHHDDVAAVYDQLKSKINKIIELLTTLSQSIIVIPGDYEKEWVAAKQNPKDTTKTTLVEGFNLPQWSIRPNTQKHGETLKIRTALTTKKLVAGAQESVWLGKNCASPVQQLLVGLKEHRKEINIIFREVEQDAPQKPSHIVLSA